MSYCLQGDKTDSYGPTSKEWKVIKNGCYHKDTGTYHDYWKWLGYVGVRGYGDCKAYTHLGEKMAHRYIYKKYKGKIPKNYQIDHLCQHKDCVNPDCLEPVTPRENCRRRNMRDPFIIKRMYKKYPKLRSKRTDLQIRCIRSLYSILGNYSEVARIIGTRDMTVRKICMHKTYKYVKG